MSYRVLATDINVSQCIDTKEILKKNNCKLDIEDLNCIDDRKKDIKRLSIIDRYDAVIAGGERWDENYFRKAAGKLKVLSRFGVGYDHVDLKAATKYGVVVTNTPGANAASVSELAITLMLALTRDLCFLHQEMRKGEWNPKSTFELRGKTVGIVGLGEIGKEVVRKLSGFKVKILAYDIERNVEFASRYHVNYVGLDELLKNSDYVTLHVPLIPATKRMISGKELRLMKKNAFLINTARGALVDECALIEALQKKEIAGAGLDVFENTPLEKDNFLRNLDNVILTPHIAATTKEACNNMAIAAAENVISILNHKKVNSILNPEVYLQK
jgi:D-3-phosphoglycerate dehydrogenase